MHVNASTLAPQILENVICQWQLCQTVLSLMSKLWHMGSADCVADNEGW